MNTTTDVSSARPLADLPGVLAVATADAYGPWASPFDGCAGIFLGGCIERGVGSSFRHQAHAHNYSGTEWFGWVCLRSPKRVLIAGTLRPSRILWHEYAHLLTPNHGHDDAWRAAMRSLSQPIPKQYRRRTR